MRRAWAERLREAQDRHPLQARVIRKQAALRRGHLPLRRLLDQTSDVLFALKPCWAMSPLMVSQVLPAARLFDVVIFDEASQIVPADAIPSIMRGHQIVVAGDDRQLPPTNFFRQVGDEGDESRRRTTRAWSRSAPASSRCSTRSARCCRPAPLAWHYRSRDERLVAFSNAHIYGGALTTFPGVLRDDCLRHVVVAQGPEPGQEVSVTAEVDKVVELILEHARTRPAESLGVIALGIRHAERIDTALRAALAAHPGLEGFFAEDRPEPFFVKNLERVQGDERDAIILSIGYGKHPDGRMRYQWGPLLRDGGERRLNVAATRAKHRLTLVSSFSSHDVDPDRVTKAGARLLADYLEYASSGGTAVGASGGGRAEPVRGRRARPAGRVRDHRRAAVRGRRLPGRLRRHAPGGRRTGWCWRSRPTAPPTGSRAASGTGTGCAASTCSGSAGASTGCGPPTGSTTRKAEVTKLRDAYDRAVAAADQAAPPGQQPEQPEPAASGRRGRAPGRGTRPGTRPQCAGRGR